MLRDTPIITTPLRRCGSLVRLLFHISCLHALVLLQEGRGSSTVTTTCLAWTTTPSPSWQRQRQRQRHLDAKTSTRLFDRRGDTESSSSTPTPPLAAVSTTAIVEDDEDAPAGIVGAEFFGGNKQKQEFYDPEAEAMAGSEFFASTAKRDTYHRFDDVTAFPTRAARELGQSLQASINAVVDATSATSSSAAAATAPTKGGISYASEVRWTTPLQVGGGAATTRNPLIALSSALTFYRNVSVAITSCCEQQSSLSSLADAQQGGSTKFQVTWEVAVTWPIFWAPRILVCLQSELVVNEKQEIVQQDDVLVGGSTTDLVTSIVAQVWPRFWDVYHIGMTPSAELSPHTIVKKALFSSYRVYDVPARLHWQPSLLDMGTRDDANAATLPNHAFTCAIKTMGPQKQDYTPASPVEVQLVPSGGGPSSNRLRLQWSIPLAVDTVARNPDLPLASTDEEGGDNDEDDENNGGLHHHPESVPRGEYAWHGPRRVAAVAFGGDPQAPNIADVRKRLYEQVIKDGWKPKLDPITGRPVFVFWQHSVKACYTLEGLGMAVYEWRPAFTKPNEVGIELELSPR